MGFNLFNCNDHFRWNHEMWHRLLEIAHEYGWEPLGPLPPLNTPLIDGEFTDGMNSDTNIPKEGVNSKDVGALIELLEKASKDIPNLQIIGMRHRPNRKADLAEDHTAMLKKALGDISNLEFTNIELRSTGEMVTPGAENDSELDQEFPKAMKSYLINIGQFVTDEDAHNLAAALEKALKDIPDEQMTEIKLRTLDEYESPRSAYFKFRKTLNIPGGGCGFIGPDPNTTNQIYFSGEAKDKLRKFIAFCQEGAFLIG